ncbi:MAG: putative TIM-barrel fold metal-dependent hydrolase [Paenibacillus sp.]|nr:putative TIM-barrel fold metal-dependent hydrolase [Paenibacillus sp.]
MRIDAHQHYWSMSRTDYGWITPELPVLYRDYLPEDLDMHRKRHNLDGTIVVQAAPTIEETEYLLSLADGADSILGVVGYLDLFRPDHRSHYERCREHPKYVGFRIMIQDMEDAGAILQPSFVEALRSYAAMDVPVDLLVKADQLEPLNELLDAVPGLRGVIDHIGKPRIAAGEFEPWASQMERASRHPGLYCKLSGMVTEADHRDWRPEHFQRYVDHVLRLFGPERVIFGTDWPVCLLAASYDEVVELLEGAIPGSWGDRERANLFGENAKRFYKL